MLSSVVSDLSLEVLGSAVILRCTAGAVLLRYVVSGVAVKCIASVILMVTGCCITVILLCE